MRDPSDRESVERLGVFYGVTTSERAFSFGHFIGTTFEDFVDDFVGEFSGRHPDDVHGRDGAPTHGVDIGKGVGGRDLTVEVGVVDDGGEEVQRLNQGRGVVELVDSGIIRSGGANEKVLVGVLAEPTQDLREVFLRKFGGSSCAG